VDRKEKKGHFGRGWGGGGKRKGGPEKKRRNRLISLEKSATSFRTSKNEGPKPKSDREKGSRRQCKIKRELV